MNVARSMQTWQHLDKTVEATALLAKLFLGPWQGLRRRIFSEGLRTSLNIAYNSLCVLETIYSWLSTVGSSRDRNWFEVCSHVFVPSMLIGHGYSDDILI